MATLPAPATDPTIDAALAALEGEEARQQPRGYLGMSAIGHECSRRLWYSFRWAAREHMTATSLLRINDGHRGEDVMAGMLRRVPGVQLMTSDPRTGEQWAFADHGGHFRGHADGMITGLLQAPKALHVWEAKVVAEDKQRKLAALCYQIGEKQALRQWDAIYHAQAQVYMHYSSAPRHYITVGTPGVRAVTSARTDYDAAEADRLRAKALDVITAAEPLPKISIDPAFWQCKFCPAAEVCHRKQLPAVSCRTCAHATPELDGDGRWSCNRWGADIPVDAQRSGCDQHRYIPTLVTVAKPVDADEAANWIEYEAPGGVRFRNGSGPGGLSSEEIRAGAWRQRAQGVAA